MTAGEASPAASDAEPRPRRAATTGLVESSPVKPFDTSKISHLDLALFRRVGGGVVYAPGEAIFRAGDPAEAMYVVVEGEIELTKDDVTLEIVPAGRPFGELGLIDGEPRALDAIARGRALIAPISADRFTRLVEEQPEFVLSLLRLLTHRLRQQTGT
jgi:CRP/FNR family cyclic AMP-dependent transcriptional regulator